MSTASEGAEATTTGAITIKRKEWWFWLGFALLVGVIVAALPTPAGLSRTGQYVLAIIVFTAILWATNAMEQSIAAILMMALMILAGVRPASALSGFASPQFWILLPVLFFGFAMQSTGLARRVAYYILNLFPATYTGILSALFLIGLVLAFGIPSMTVRTAILAPIAWAVVGSLGLAPRSRGTALIMLSCVEMATLPGCAFLYSSLFGPVVESLFQTRGFPLSWLGYARVVTLPTLLLCALLLAANRLLLKPEAPLDVAPRFAREHLRALGPIKRTEMMTAAVILVSIVYWITDRIHHQPAFVIGMLALAVLALAGIVSGRDINAGVPWGLLLFLGGVFSLTSVIQEQKITDWLAAFIVPMTQQFVSQRILFVTAVAVAMFLVRFLDPAAFVSLTVLFLPISTIVGAAGISPLVLVAVLVLSSMPFWLSYENVWVAMSDGITSGQAFTTSQRLRLAHTYAIVTIIALIISVGYWKLIGSL